MTIVFQTLVVVAIVAASWFVLRGRGARHQAIRRVAMLLFMVAVASSVFFPTTWTWAANKLGIGRGTDLLLYLLAVSFFAFVATTYRRSRHVEAQVTELARQLALAFEAKPQDDETDPAPQSL